MDKMTQIKQNKIKKVKEVKEGFGSYRYADFMNEDYKKNRTLFLGEIKK